MELIKKNIHMEHRINLADTQISLEEDQNISDQKPDAFQIICKKACVKIGESKVQEGAVWVKGMLLYKVLYLTDEKDKRLCSIDGEIPFEEKIYTNGNATGDGARIRAKAEDLVMRLINSRKLNIRCIVAISIMQDELYDEEVAVDVEQPNACEILKKNMDVTAIALDTRDIYRIKEEITLPDGLPNIYNLLWKDIRLEGLNFVPMEGRIGIQGEWNAFFLYEGEEENEPRCFEITRPFSGILEVPDCMETMVLCVDHEADTPIIEVKSDYDGEERIISIDLEIKLFIKLYQNQMLSLVADAYGLIEPLEPVMKESMCEQILKKENGKIKLSDVWENKESQEESLQILHVDGDILDENIAIKEEEAQLTGVVHLEILCSTNNENSPYRCVTIDLPYNQMSSIIGATKENSHFGKVSIEQLTANIQGNRIEARVMLSYQLIVFQKIEEPLLVTMEQKTTTDVDATLPVMSVYFAKDKENIWGVGKKYRVSLNEIRRINQLDSDELKDGQKVLIVKEMPQIY